MRSADEILDALTTECLDDAGLMSRAQQIALLERWREDATEDAVRDAERAAAEEERVAKNSWYMRCRALEDDFEEVASVLGAVCMVGTLEPDEESAQLDNHGHAAVQTAMRIRWERDAARGALRHAEAEVASLRVVANAAKEYLMRSVPDPNVGTAAEDTLREALADIEMTDDEPERGPAKDITGCDV